ncbi:hypothetical protein NDU88_005535 [Pleurodeles waltl]|uniref:Uncharacterized protein n=1 Tax=Pleurodeles waltl TaxID=8319 RepID=A0AAV7PID4_PLEWA|nr:hypothetical protein NDU88_005535 [Pleurodeles waltl]
MPDNPLKMDTKLETKPLKQSEGYTLTIRNSSLVSLQPLSPPPYPEDMLPTKVAQVTKDTTTKELIKAVAQIHGLPQWPRTGLDTSEAGLKPSSKDAGSQFEHLPNVVNDLPLDGS